MIQLQYSREIYQAVGSTSQALLRDGCDPERVVGMIVSDWANREPSKSIAVNRPANPGPQRVTRDWQKHSVAK